MNKTNDKAVMNTVSYCAPETKILEIKSEGILCSSNGSWADDITVGDGLKDSDYEQIY